jgi:hypothetical protein
VSDRPIRPHLDNQHVLSLDAIFGAHLMTSVDRRTPPTKRHDDSLDSLEFNFRERQLPPPLLYGRRADSPSGLSSILPTQGSRIVVISPSVIDRTSANPKTSQTGNTALILDAAPIKVPPRVMKSSISNTRRGASSDDETDMLSK